VTEMVKYIDQLDGIVHAAGMVYPFPAKFIREKHLLTVMKINFFAPVILNATLLGANKFNAFASVVFISSISTKHPYFGGSLYVSSKAALEAYSRNFALEVAAKKIRSNVISPALVKTSIFDLTMESFNQQEIENYEKNYPFGFGEPEDVAHAALFLLSSESKWITGQEFILDGGLTLGAKS
jgi:NAD(P)-dependent dehydrogenase (short-subunit alcohol dehydrogenase family)